MRRPLFAALAAAALLSACQDPAGVGLGLIDDDGGAGPNVRPVEATTVDTLQTSSPAIGFADEREARHQPRVLVGDVTDAVFGDARAIAYVDALQPAAARELEAGDVRRIWVELRRDYAYGDTTTTLPVTLRAVTPRDDEAGAWSVSASYPSDTTFATGPALLTVPVTTAAADTLVRFDLPASWVSANAATFVGDAFASGFEGFALSVDSRPAGAGAVYGFNTTDQAGSRIRLATAEDTLDFPLQEVFSSITRTDPTLAPATIVPARSFSGIGARLAFDLAAVGPLPLARASLSVPIERSFVRDGSFVRPLAVRSGLFGIRASDDARLFLGDVVISDDGAARTVLTTALTPALQQVLIGDLDIDRFELIPSVSATTPLPAASLDILPVLRSDVNGVPRFTLTVIGGETSP